MKLFHFFFTIQISNYRKRIDLSAVCFFVCIGWEGQKVWQKGQEGSGAFWCIPLFMCLPMLDHVLTSLKTQEPPGFSPSIFYTPGRKTTTIKTVLPFSMGWGAISSCLGFLLGPEREFREPFLLPSVPGEATGKLLGKGKEFRPIISFIQSSLHCILHGAFYSL